LSFKDEVDDSKGMIDSDIKANNKKGISNKR